MNADVLVPVLVALAGVVGSVLVGRIARRTQVETAHLAHEAEETRLAIDRNAQVQDAQGSLLDRYERRIVELEARATRAEAEVEACHQGRATDRRAGEERERRLDERVQHALAEIDRLETEMRGR